MWLQRYAALSQRKHVEEEKDFSIVFVLEDENHSCPTVTRWTRMLDPGPGVEP
jgi:hypothetical protein